MHSRVMDSESPGGKLRIGSIVIRCYEFDKMLAFGQGPNVSLDQFPERRTGRRSRLHLDLYAADQEGEVERLVTLGATRYPWRYRPGDDFVVLEDPDGNLFCVVQA